MKSAIEEQAQIKLMEQAKELGAIKYKVFSIEHRRNSQDAKIEFSYHFFNSGEMEICYFICDLKQEFGLTLLGFPRQWSEEFLNHPAYTPFITI